MKKPPPEMPGDDREARLTALLFGELPAAEAKELAAELERDPELRALSEQLAGTIGLLRESFETAAAPAKLSPKKREGLLGRFKSVPVSGSRVPAQRTRWWQLRVPLVPLAAAACILFLLGGMLLPSLSKAKAKAQRFAAAGPRSEGAPQGVNDLWSEPQAGKTVGSADTASLLAAERKQAGRSSEIRFYRSSDGREVSGLGEDLDATGFAVAPSEGTEAFRQLRERAAPTVAPQSGQHVDFFVGNSGAQARPASGASEQIQRDYLSDRYEVWGAMNRDPFGGSLDQGEGLGDARPEAATDPPRQRSGSVSWGDTGGMGGAGGFGGGGFGGGMAGGEIVPQGVNRGFQANAGFGRFQERPAVGSEASGPAAADDSLAVAALGGEAAFGTYFDTAADGIDKAGKVVALRVAPPTGPVNEDALALPSPDGATARYALSPEDGRDLDRDRDMELSRRTPADDSLTGGRIGGTGAGRMLRRYGAFTSQDAPAADRRGVQVNENDFAAPVVPPPAEPPAAGQPVASDEFFAGDSVAPAPAAEPAASTASPSSPGDRSAGQVVTWSMPVRGESGPVVDAEVESLVTGLSEANKAFSKGATVRSAEAGDVVEGLSRGRALGLAASDSKASIVSESAGRPNLRVEERYQEEFDTGMGADHGVSVANGGVPVLGDVPTLGRLFRRSESAVEAEPEPAAEELAELPLKLPLPAFMGTPTELSLHSAPVPQRESSRSRMRGPEANGRGGAIAVAEGEVLGLSKPKSEEMSRKREDVKVDTFADERPIGAVELVQELEPARLPGLRQRLAETRSGIEAGTRAPATPPVAGKPVTSDIIKAPAREEMEESAKRLPEPPAAPRQPAPIPAEPLPEIRTAENPFSTFSLNVADVTFKLAAASLDRGQLPARGSVRSEEFVNAFDYRDPEPTGGEPVGFVWERARFPFAHNREVLRFALKTAATGRETGRPLNLVLLLDSSGSMERADRVNIVRTALEVLGSQLQPQDRLSVVTFSSVATLRADGLSGAEARAALQRATEIPPEGGTNLEDALRVAYETAQRHFRREGMNRVVVLTDGAANLGNVAPVALKALVEENRRQGVALDAFGIGWEGYNDDLLEVLTRNGDGRYGFINTPEAAATDFAGQLAGALQVAAADVKVQVEFNPARVAAYRQVGYQKHQLTKEQFRDNTVDAAEIGAAEQGNALYVAELKPDGQGPIGYLRVRYRVPSSGRYEEKEWLLDYNGPAVRLEEASPALRLATVAAGFAEWLNGSPYAGEVTLDRLQGLIRDVPERYPRDPRPGQVAEMLQRARSLSGR